MHDDKIPTYCRILLESLREPEDLFLHFDQKSKRFDGMTFKNKDLLNASKLREIETLITQPFYGLLEHLQRVNQRYALVSYAGIELHEKEELFLQISTKMLARTLKSGDFTAWGSAYPKLRLVETDSEKPPNWETERVKYVALVEFLVRDLGFYSASVMDTNEDAEEAFSSYVPRPPRQVSLSSKPAENRRRNSNAPNNRDL